MTKKKSELPMKMSRGTLTEENKVLIFAGCCTELSPNPYIAL